MRRVRWQLSRVGVNPRSIAQTGVVVGPLLALAILGWQHRWTFDDGLIYFRVVRNLLDGAGPVFNPGERVEAYTGPAWLALLAVSKLVIPVKLESLAVFLGIGTTVGGTALAMLGSARLWRRSGDQGFLVPFGVIVIAGLFPMWVWMTAGLELGLTFLWLGAACALLGRWATRDGEPMGPAAMCLLGLGWVIRPEAIVTSAVLVLTVILFDWGGASRRQRIGQIVSAIAIPTIYEVFRVAYFGMLVSNTAVAKEGTKFSLRQGWHYMNNFAGPYQLWIAVMIIVVLGFVPLVSLALRKGSSRVTAAVLALAGAALAGAVLVVANGGDYLHARLFLPSVFLIISPIALAPIRRCAPGLVLLLAWGFAAGVHYRPPELKAPIVEHAFTLQFQLVDPPTSETPWLKIPGPISVQQQMVGLTPVAAKPIQGLHQPAAAVALLGAYGYFRPNLYIVDVLGLANIQASHQRLVARGYPGHEKYFGAPWIAATMIAPSSEVEASDMTTFKPGAFDYPNATPNGDHPFDVAVSAARRALRCGGLADLRRATTGALSLSRILSNIRGSVARTQFRYSSDPVIAERELCR